MPVKTQTTMITGEHLLLAAQWFKAHETHVRDLVAKYKNRVPFPKAYSPSGSDRAHPELWKAAHWSWYMEREHV